MAEIFIFGMTNGYTPQFFKDSRFQIPIFVQGFQILLIRWNIKQDFKMAFPDIAREILDMST